MSYLRFQIKKVLQNNLTIISVIILILLSFFILYMNSSSSQDTSLLSQAEGNVSMQKKYIHQMKIDLHKYSSKSERAKIFKQDIQDAKKLLNSNTKLVKNIKHKKWKSVYKAQLAANYKVKKVQGNDINSDEKNGIEQNIKLFNYLIKNPMAYESDAPVTGIQFLLDLNQKYLPFLYSLIIIFILALLYTDNYKNKMDIANLIPFSHSQLLLTNLLSGFIITASIFFFLNLLLFVGSSIIFGSGNVDYPYLTYYFINGHFLIKYIPSIKIFWPTIGLLILDSIFIVSFTLLVAKIVKEKFPTLLLVILLVPGISLATVVIEPIQRISQWLPTTYLNAVNIVSGQYAHQVMNKNINFNSGICTLSLSILLTIALILVLGKSKNKVA